MQYLDRNYSSKAAVKRALAEGAEIRVNVVEPQISGRSVKSKKFGTVTEHTVAGPWFPQPHSWYGNVRVNDAGLVVEVK
jgi:hypothetical protein